MSAMPSKMREFFDSAAPPPNSPDIVINPDCIKRFLQDEAVDASLDVEFRADPDVPSPPRPATLAPGRQGRDKYFIALSTQVETVRDAYIVFFLTFKNGDRVYIARTSNPYTLSGMSLTITMPFSIGV